MISKLPLEIISLVASYLSQQDRITCLGICKHWLPVFQHSLWRNLSINDTFLSSIHETPGLKDVYKTNGFRVQKLKITSDHRVQKEHFEILQQLFPCIRHLEFLVDVQQDLCTVDIFDWNLWTSLTQLEIPLDDSIRELGPNGTFEKLSSLKSLVRFNMISYNSTEIDYRFKLEDFEALYHHLPNLVCVESDYDIGTLFLDDLKNTHIVPAVTVKRIICREIYTRFNNYWLIYYGLKYPKLETLSLNINTGIQRIQLTSQDYLKSVLSTFPNMFCSLKTLETNDNSYYAGNMISLHHGIELFEPQIEELSICLQTFQKRYLSLESVLYFTYVFAATLKELTLTLSIYCYPIKSTLNQTIYYPVLMHLNMNILDGYVQIDYVLNQCPLLQTFQVYGYAVTLGQNPSSFPHGLRELKIDCKCLDIDVMSYISYRCRYLGRLKLNVLSLNPRQLKKTFFVFDMGYTQLDELYISNIIIMTGPCRLFTIEETDKCGQYENSDPSCASSQKLKTYKALPICYALQKIRSSGIPKTFRAVRMSRRHIRKVQMCYPNFGCPSSPHEEVEYTSEVDHIPDNYWKPFVYKGYLTFKCKSVKNHHILPYEPRL